MEKMNDQIGKEIKHFNDLHVLSMSSIGRNRWKIKLKENIPHLLTLSHQGREFHIIREYGRGRYLMEEIFPPSQEDMDKEWDDLGEGKEDNQG